MDIPPASLIQLELLDDEETPQSRTLWSDPVLEAARGAAKGGRNLHAVILALRGEIKVQDDGTSGIAETLIATTNLL